MSILYTHKGYNNTEGHCKSDYLNSRTQNNIIHKICILPEADDESSDFGLSF